MQLLQEAFEATKREDWDAAIVALRKALRAPGELPPELIKGMLGRSLANRAILRLRALAEGPGVAQSEALSALEGIKRDLLEAKEFEPSNEQTRKLLAEVDRLIRGVQEGGRLAPPPKARRNPIGRVLLYWANAVVILASIGIAASLALPASSFSGFPLVAAIADAARTIWEGEVFMRAMILLLAFIAVVVGLPQALCAFCLEFRPIAFIFRVCGAPAETGFGRLVAATLYGFALLLATASTAVIYNRMEKRVLEARRPEVVVPPKRAQAPSAAPSAASETRYAMPVNAGVIFRTGPNSTLDVAAKSNRGEKFEVIGQEGSWIKVRLSGSQAGWVHRVAVDIRSETIR